MGMGKGTSNTQANLTPEQKQLLGAQTNFLTGTAFPAYQQTVGGAGAALAKTAPEAEAAAQRAIQTSQRTGLIQEAGGTGAYLSGLTNLMGLYTPEYKQQQIKAALQPATEDIREQMNNQYSLFGGAGALGSARQALASRNLASLSQARLGNVAAQTSADIEARRQKAAETLLTTGQTGLTGAQQSATAQVGLAQTPQDIYSKYASIVYGVPQGNTTANFQGTQGSSTSGKSSGIRL